MNLKRRDIILTGVFCLVYTFLFSTEKYVKYGMGYKTFEFTSHNNLIHSGRYLYGGFSYEFGNKYLNRIQFQVSNSNREMMLDILYVSAATAINIHYDFAIQTISLKKSRHYFGLHVGNDFNLNFFPKIDSRNLLWFNQSFTGLSLMSKYKLKNNNRIDFSSHIPVISTLLYNRLNRLTSEIPGNRSIQSFSGFSNKLFNADAEIGYIFSKFGFDWGVYYQIEINRMNETSSNRLKGIAQSASLRIIY